MQHVILTESGNAAGLITHQTLKVKVCYLGIRLDTRQSREYGTTLNENKFSWGEKALTLSNSTLLN